jgi:hypothetical protein
VSEWAGHVRWAQSATGFKIGREFNQRSYLRLLSTVEPECLLDIELLRTRMTDFTRLARRCGKPQQRRHKHPYLSMSELSLLFRPDGGGGAY